MTPQRSYRPSKLTLRLGGLTTRNSTENSMSSTRHRAATALLLIGLSWTLSACGAPAPVVDRPSIPASLVTVEERPVAPSNPTAAEVGRFIVTLEHYADRGWQRVGEIGALLKKLGMIEGEK
jgi:hypothetical protein